MSDFFQARLRFGEVFKKTRQIIAEKKTGFWLVVIMLALPIAVCAAYTGYSNFGVIVQKLLKVTDVNELTALLESASNTEFVFGDYAIDIVMQLMQVFLIGYVLLLAVSALSKTMLKTSEVFFAASKKIIPLFILYFIFSYFMQFVLSLSAGGMMTVYSLAVASGNAAIGIVLLCLSVLIAAAIVLFGGAFFAAYMYNMFVAVGIGRCRLLFAFAYIREIMKGRVFKQVLRMLPWVALTILLPQALSIPGVLLFAVSDSAAMAVIAASSIIETVLSAVMWVFISVDFFNLEATSEFGVRMRDAFGATGNDGCNKDE